MKSRMTTKSIKQNIKLVEDKGSGQALIALFEEVIDTELPFYLVDTFTKEGRVIVISLPRLDDVACHDLTAELISFMDEHSIRQASFIGFGEAGAVVQNLAVAHQKRVRRIILVDSPTRPNLSFVEKILNRLEKALPLGLPFRSGKATFDSRSFLQRIRCPSLVLITGSASDYIKAQGDILRNSLATAWFKDLTLLKIEQELPVLLQEFYLIPAKRPQKNRG